MHRPGGTGRQRERQMGFKINPAWKAYNDLQNEGSEGYNPHPKWIVGSPQAAQPKTVAAAASTTMLKDERGNLIPSDKLHARLEKDLARLERITDPSARAITEQSIAHARRQLGL